MYLAFIISAEEINAPVRLIIKLFCKMIPIFFFPSGWPPNSWGNKVSHALDKP